MCDKRPAGQSRAHVLGDRRARSADRAAADGWAEQRRRGPPRWSAAPRRANLWCGLPTTGELTGYVDEPELPPEEPPLVLPSLLLPEAELELPGSVELEEVEVDVLVVVSGGGTGLHWPSS